MMRPYRSQDLEALLDVWQRASAVAHPFVEADFLERERRNIPEVYLPHADTWVWEEGGKVVGFLALLGNEVGGLFVDPTRHRHGIGLHFIEHAARLHGALEVEVFERNDIGRAFYAAVGFEPMHSKVHEETGLALLRLQRPAPAPAATVSAAPDVQQFYDETADGYASLMDTEIDLPVYEDHLGRLAQRLAEQEGPIVDTSCGPGHLLQRYRERFDAQRQLVAIDLAPRMVELARQRLGDEATCAVGDMCDLSSMPAGGAAALLSYFALHHVDAASAARAFAAWHRVLRPGGQLLAAAWEGQGTIDYGEHASIEALRYTREEIEGLATSSGFRIDRCVVDVVDDMPMDAVYVEATRL